MCEWGFGCTNSHEFIYREKNEAVFWWRTQKLGFSSEKTIEKKVIITSVKKNQNSKKMKNIETWYKKLLSTLKKIIFVKNVIWV